MKRFKTLIFATKKETSGKITYFCGFPEVFLCFTEKIKNKPDNLTPVFSIEGGAVIENDSDRVFELQNDGIRFLTLAWNGENAIAGGINSDKCLTDFGKEVIEKMNRLKMGCDLSHLNKESFYKVLEFSEFSLATHSNCKEICDHPRNLELAQIKLLFEKKGIMGLCFYPLFLGGDVFEKIYQNIYLLCDKGYENNIAIGSDFDGAGMSEKLDNISKVPLLYRFLEERGIERGVLDKIFYKNAYNYIANLK